jgi:AraC-like DNA-binding protein
MKNYFFEMVPLRALPKENESLTSLLVRIAARNRVKTFAGMGALFFPEQDPGVVKRCADFPPVKIGKLSTVTNIPEPRILETTFYYLTKNFGRSTRPQRASRFLLGAIANKLRYCPQCLADDPYYRLSWRFMHITFCSDHCRVLLDRCGYCGKDIPVFAMPPQIGICPSCDKKLWQLPPGELTLDRISIEKETTALRIILQPITNWHEYGCQDLTKFFGASLRELRQSYGINRPDIGKMLKMDTKYISSFETGDMNRARLNFSNYLTYMNSIGTTMYDVLCEKRIPRKKNAPSNPPIKNSFNDTISNNVGLSLLTITQAIRDLTHANQKISTRAIARRVGVSPSTLYRNKELREALPSWRTKAHGHKHRISAKITELNAIYEDFQRKGEEPSIKDIKKIMGSCVSYSPEMREWLQKKKADSQSGSQIHTEDFILERLDATIDKLIKHGQSLTHRNICREFQISRRALDNFPQVKQKLREFRKKHRSSPDIEENLLLKIQMVRAELKLKGIKETQTEIASRIGRSAPGLKRYPRIRAIMAEVAKTSRKRTSI